MKRRLIIAIAALALSGCATVEGDCPLTGSETFAVGGSTVGNQIIALGAVAAQGAMKSGGLMGAKVGTTDPSAPKPLHFKYSWIPIFGSDYVACQSSEAPAPLPNPFPVTVVPTAVAK